MAVPERVTLKTLADELGLNVSTVSRVLNAPPGSETKWASDETIERITRLAAERGYVRNPHAASLRTAKSDLVGVIVPRLQDYVLATIYEGIDAAAAERGLLSVVANSLDNPATTRAKAESLLARRADGLVFGDARAGDPLLGELAARGVPLALVSRRLDGHVSVSCDDAEGGRQIAEHIVASGRRRIAVIAGARYASTTRDRLDGFSRTLDAHGIALPESAIHYAGFDANAGKAAISAILASGEVPEAIFAVNDFVAIGAISELQSRGLSVPGDVAVAGFNDTPLAEAVNLTTVRSPMAEMGRAALEKLLDIADGRGAESERLTPELVVRESA